MLDGFPRFRTTGGLVAFVAAACFAALLAGRALNVAGGVPAILADKDFANYWIASRLVLSGEALDLFGDHKTYFGHLQDAFGPDYPWRNWSYPPHYLLFIWPLGLMNYASSMALFLAVTLGIYLLAARSVLQRLDADSVVVVAPFILVNLWTTQNGFLTGALMIGALAVRYERPALAGVLAGFLTIKPQFGILLPVLFLIEGQWKAIASAAATTLALVALSAMAFGLQSWVGYFTSTLPYQSAVIIHGEGVFLWMTPSLFGSLRSWGFGADVALAVHALFAFPVLAVTALVLIRSADPFQRMAVVVLATLLVSPYWLIYDFGAAAIILAALRSVSRGETAPKRQCWLYAAYTPLLAVPLGAASVPVLPLLLLAAFLATLSRRSSRTTSAAAPPKPGARY